MKNIYKILGLMSLGLVMISPLQAQTDWGITAEQKAEKLKIPFTEANQEAGLAIFEKNCKACHSKIKVVPKNQRQLPLAPNLGCQVFQSTNSDGEIFWKISNGHIASGMPPYGSSLSEDERWKIVTYLRTFYTGYEPPADAGAAPVGPPAEKFTGTINSITLSLDTDNQKLTAKLDAVDEEGNPAYAKNVKVDIYIKRQFGSLLLGTIKTNDKGEAIVDCPANIPADTNGNITVSAVTADSSVYMSMQVAYGEKLNWKNPLDENHMWGTSAKAPVWIKTTYLSVVILVWLVIFWAAFQLVRIYSLRER